MLRKSLFALSAILLLGSVAACGDDGEKKDPTVKPPVTPEVSCEEDPTQDKCPKNYANAREGKLYSYVAGLKLPAAAEEGSEGAATCCFDYDGDKAYDNALGNLLPLVTVAAPDLDLGELLEGVFQDGDITLIFEHDKYPTDIQTQGNFDMKLFMGEATAESDWEARRDGNGVYTLGTELTQIKGAVNRRAIVEARADKLPIELDLTSFGADVGDIIPGGKLTLPLSIVRLNFHVKEKADVGLYNEVTGSDFSLVTEAKGKAINFLSGGLHGDEIAKLVNEIIGGMCDYSEPIMTFDATKGTAGEDGELAAPLFDISQDAIDVFDASSDGTCVTIGGFLPAIGILGGLFDVDSTGNGVADTLSVGFNLQIAAAAIAE